MSQDSLSRRGFLRVATGTGVGAGAVAAGGAATAQSERPDWGGWLDGVDGGYEDHRGQDEVVVEVGASGNGGNLAFAPAGVWVDQGATVVWEWTGQGGAHNVVSAGDSDFDFDSGDPKESGDPFEQSFDNTGVGLYLCEPHESLGMKGGFVVVE